jgi:hypothetical protein
MARNRSRHPTLPLPYLKRVAVAAAFVSWEAYWAYVFVSTPRPDEEMHTLVAIFMGVVLPLIIAAAEVIYRTNKSPD